MSFWLPDCGAVWIIYTVELSIGIKLSPTKCTVMRLNSLRKKYEHLTVDAVYVVIHYLLCQQLLILVSAMTINLVLDHIYTVLHLKPL